MRLTLETLTLILRPLSDFPECVNLRIMVKVSGPTFNIFFMVWVRVGVIYGYDVMLKMSTAVRIKLQIEMWQFTPTEKSKA